MSLNHAILGILSYKPIAGYDIKKVLQDSAFMYWSGNNNQVYKALVELHAGGLVTNKVFHQDGAPSKKVYSITDQGLAELKRWALTAPEAPEFKKAFLVQLAWTWQASPGEMAGLLDQYQQEIEGQLLMAKWKRDNGHFSPDRTPRERAVWRLIHDNIVGSYQHELDWIATVRGAIEPTNGEDASL